MSTTVLLLSLVALFVFYLYKKKGSNASEFKELSKDQTSRYIYVYDMDEQTLQEAVDSFIPLYSENGDMERPSIDQEDECYRLTFSPNVDYIALCYWVNHLVYSDEEKQIRYKVYGWYPFGEVQLNGEKQPYSNQTVMMYIDKDDTEHDNISFVTPDGNHYLQSFAIGNNLKQIAGGSESYQPCPIYKTQETQ